MEIKPIACFKSPFPSKFGIPRQAGLAGTLKGRLVFEPEFRSPDAVRGLEAFDYVWLIWGFSSTGSRTFKATVRPPRLGGNERVGVFATRSPFRPNALGLSCVRLDSIDLDARGEDGQPIGPVINVLGADLMDGTPVYDIKPYIEYSDSRPGVRSGFVDSVSWKTLEVVFQDGVELEGIDSEALGEVLSLDPRPAYHDDPGKVYGMVYEGHEVRFKVEGDVLIVLSIK